MGDAIVRCDLLYDAGKHKEAYDAIMAVQADPNPEIRWRVVRMKFKMAEKSTDPIQKKAAINDGIATLEDQLKRYPNCPHSNKWMAILLASKDEHESLKQRIVEAFLIREHLEKSLLFNPSDGYAHFILGRWCYQVASVGWLQRKAAAALIACPPESSYQEALDHFVKAEILNPEIFNSCYLMAAKCLLALGQKEKAAEYLKKCIEKCSNDDDSLANRTEAHDIMKKHKITF